MKIAVSAQGAALESPVDPRFGRARFFVVFDTETGGASATDNAVNLNAAQGAGIQAAGNVSDLGVQAVITGNVGPKAYAALSAAGVRVYIGASGTVRQAIDAFQSGKLSPAEKPNVVGHWM